MGSEKGITCHASAPCELVAMPRCMLINSPGGPFPGRRGCLTGISLHKLTILKTAHVYSGNIFHAHGNKGNMQETYMQLFFFTSYALFVCQAYASRLEQFIQKISGGGGRYAASRGRRTCESNTLQALHSHIALSNCRERERERERESYQRQTF